MSIDTGKKIIVAGSRGINDFQEVIHAISLTGLRDDDISHIVSGTARGVDRMGEQWAHMRDIDIIRMPANWNKYGKSAGYIRNEQMAQTADILVAVWDGESRGTSHMINLAKQYGLDVYVWNTKTRKAM
jgi:hypothetical protein